MAAVVLDIADAVVTQLNAAVPLAGQTFAAVRDDDVQYSHEDLSTLRVTVVPLSDAQVTAADRRRDLIDYVVSIGVHKQRPPLKADRDALVNLVEAIANLFRRGSAAGRTCVAAEVGSYYSVLKARDEREFLGWVNLTFRGVTA